MLKVQATPTEPIAGEFTLNVNDLKRKLKEKVEEVREKLPPIVLMKDLHPKYFVVRDDEIHKVSAAICDENGLRYAKLLYSTDKTSWKEAESSIKTLADTDILNFEVNSQIYEIKGTVALQKAGTVVFYKFVAEDEDGNKAESPTEVYFVVDDESKLKVVVVDTWVKLWLLKINAEK
jgi:hypothetical protein